MAKFFYRDQAKLEREHLESLVAELRSALEQHGANYLGREHVEAIHAAADAVAGATRLIRERSVFSEEARNLTARLGL